MVTNIHHPLTNDDAPQGRFQKAKAYIGRNRWALGLGAAAGVGGIFFGPLVCGFGFFMGSYIGTIVEYGQSQRTGHISTPEGDRIVACSVVPFLALALPYFGIDRINNHNSEAVQAAQTEICKGAKSVEKPFQRFPEAVASFKFWNPKYTPAIQKAGVIDQRDGNILGFTRVVRPYDKAGLANGVRVGDTIFDCTHLDGGKGMNVWKHSTPFDGTVRIPLRGNQTEVVQFAYKPEKQSYQVVGRAIVPNVD